MKRLVVGCVVILNGPACHAEPAPDAATSRILVYTRTTEFRHASIPAAIDAFERIGEQMDLAVDATERPEDFTPANLARYRAVVFLSTTGDVLNPEQQRHFEEYIQGGGGFMGVHAATDTEYDWPWYGRLVGAYFNGHPDIREAALVISDSTHAAVRTLPNPWRRTDEWYDLRDLNPAVRPVLSIDESSYVSPQEGPSPDPRPIAWYHEYDGGRAFYTALGHTDASWSEPLFIEHIAGGLQSVVTP